MPFGFMTPITVPVIQPGGEYGVDHNGNSAITGKDAADGAAKDFQDYWEPGNVITDWYNHENVFEHNEALAAYEREAKAAEAAWNRESAFNASEAQKARDFEAMMSNTAMTRKVVDYMRAGFSPLAALEGTVGASTPTGAAATATGHKASAPAASLGSNNFGGVLGAFMTMIAMIATKSISAVSKAAASSGKAAAAASNAVDKAGLKEIIHSELGPDSAAEVLKKYAKDDFKNNIKEYADIFKEAEASRLAKMHSKSIKSMQAKWAAEAYARHKKFG